MTFVAGLRPSVRNRWRQRLKSTRQILIAKKPVVDPYQVARAESRVNQVCHNHRSANRGALMSRFETGKLLRFLVAFSPCSVPKLCSQCSLTGHLNRGIDGVFELVCVVRRGLISIAEVHAIVARAKLAQSEPEMARDRFGFLERHEYFREMPQGYSVSSADRCEV